jgi:hypothetical protein
MWAEKTKKEHEPSFSGKKTKNLRFRVFFLTLRQWVWRRWGGLAEISAGAVLARVFAASLGGGSPQREAPTKKINERSFGAGFRARLGTYFFWLQ